MAQLPDAGDTLTSFPGASPGIFTYLPVDMNLTLVANIKIRNLKVLKLGEALACINRQQCYFVYFADQNQCLQKVGKP